MKVVQQMEVTPIRRTSFTPHFEFYQDQIAISKFITGFTSTTSITVHVSKELQKKYDEKQKNSWWCTKYVTGEAQSTCS